MKIAACLLILSVAAVCLSNAKKLRFDNHKVFSITARNEEQVQELRKLETDPAGEYQFWTTSGLKEPIDIVVPPHKEHEFLALSAKLKLESKIKIENLQELIDLESPLNQPRADFGWESYYTVPEIYAFLDDLLARYPDILTAHTVGYSFEGTEIRAVKLSHKPGNTAVLIEATIHAREWITAATATYILNELLTSTDPVIQDLAYNNDWFFIPVFNPDGFTYTKTTNRMWRKTRYPHHHLCYGVDLNRNFDFQWMHVGASQNPCDETYAGPTAFSDPESRALRDFYLLHQDQIKVFFAFHSYGQYILSPYGYTIDHADNYQELVQIGTAGATAIRTRYGTEYTVGSTAEVLYFNSGSSRDYLKGVHNVNVSYTIEFRDKGTYGFILPPNQILPNSLEMLDGVIAMVLESRILGYL